ncbi:hypothetical protein FNU79_02900 [Deinococcus detaillensis]|uniref:Uncharacterized protein n=1 Tax=Deinococcus detaillensis TaxID=2592048 RepID=A0A553V4P9_9DEIO|nr:hypothetical protein [Deinococcus detaillensis]TSA87447.1 hypothetical protein FNU79_02900 [Deinococcus detaillensis]
MNLLTPTPPEAENPNTVNTKKLPYSPPQLEKAGQWQALTLARSFPIGVGSLNFTNTRNNDWEF